jgi:hypothetical protein
MGRAVEEQTTEVAERLWGGNSHEADMASASPPTPRTMPKLLKATYLADGEQLLRETRATALYYFPGPVLGLILVLLFDYAAASVVYTSWPSFPGITNWGRTNSTLGGHSTGTILEIVGLILTLIVLLWLLVRYLRWIRTVYAVTTNRVIVQRGILGRDFDEIPIPQVRGVDVHQSIGQRILHYGSVTVSSEAGTSRSLGNESWHGIPKPFEFQRLVENATQNLSRNVGGGGWNQAPRGP